MSNLFTGTINTNGEYQNLATLADITFTQDTVYAIQIQNSAWLREGTNGKGFLFNNDKGYNWKCTGDDLYIKTSGQSVIINIAENSGFFLNKSQGGTTINNEDITVTQNGEYTASSGYTGLGTVTVDFEVNNEDITATENGTYTASSGYDGLGTVTVNVPNTAQIQKDNVIRTVPSGVQGKVPDTTHYTNTGSVTVSSDYVASGFGSGKYLELPNAFSPGNSPWEMVFEFTTGTFGNYQGILTGKGSSDGITPFYLNNSNFVTHMSSNGTSWDLASATVIMPAQINTTYRMKAEYTGNEYNWYLWNGTNFDLVETLSISTPIYSGLNYVIGNNRGTSTSTSQGCFAGTVNLKECYIKIDGQLWWEAVTRGTDWQNL